jgi:mRNA interferase RelE/StbE
MVSYKVILLPSAEKDWYNIPQKDARRIFERIEKLAENPRPYGCEKLRGQNTYRIRQGDYRIIYEIKDKVLIVLVLRIGHRRDIYRVSEDKAEFNTGDAARK